MRAHSSSENKEDKTRKGRGMFVRGQSARHLKMDRSVWMVGVGVEHPVRARVQFDHSISCLARMRAYIQNLPHAVWQISASAPDCHYSAEYSVLALLFRNCEPVRGFIVDSCISGPSISIYWREGGEGLSANLFAFCWSLPACSRKGRPTDTP